MRDSSSLRLPPGPPGAVFSFNIMEGWRDPIGMMRRQTERHGDIVWMRFGPVRYVVVNHPDGVRRILVENAANYAKSESYKGLKLVLGEGLVTSEGELWKRQRKLAQPAFHRERLMAFASQMCDLTGGMIRAGIRKHRAHSTSTKK